MADKKNKNSGNGIALGSCFGVVFGAAYGIISGNIAIGACFGLAIGLFIGAIFDFVKNRQEKSLAKCKAFLLKLPLQTKDATIMR